jgi:hypothetical protein
MSAEVIDLRFYRPVRAVPASASRGAAVPLANPGVVYEAWVESNAKRIWALLQRSNRRDRTFNDFALELWRTL